MGVTLNWSSDYPLSVDDQVTNFPILSDNVHDVLDSHVNELASAVVALQNAAGGFRTTFVADPLSPSNGEVLTYNNGSGEWESAAPVVGSLQLAYEGGNTIAVVSAEGSVTLSNATDTTHLLTLTRTFAGAGKGIVLVMGASTTEEAVDITVPVGSAALVATDGVDTSSLLAPQLRMADGDATNPAVSFGAETGSGLYRVSAGTLAWSILGTAEMVLTATELRPGAPATSSLGASAQPWLNVYARTYYVETSIQAEDANEGLVLLGNLTTGVAGGVLQATNLVGLSAASGVQLLMDLSVDLAQSGTAGFTAHKIDITTTSTGSGVVELASWSMTGTEHFNMGGGGELKVSDSFGFLTEPNTTIRMASASPPVLELNVESGPALQLKRVLDIATGNETAFNFQATVNKATSGNYVGLLVDITETAAPGTDDRLLDLQVGAVSQLYITNDGLVQAPIGAVTTPSIAVGESTTGLYRPAANQLGLAADSEAVIVDNDSATPSFRPDADNVWTLGEAALRWADIFATQTTVGDLNLKSLHDEGHWTINEDVDGIYLHDRRNGKSYKFLVEEVTNAPVPLPLKEA